MSKKIKIFVADDHPIVREGLVAVLETQADFEIVGEAADGQEVIEQIVATETDILFLDLAMPRKDGVQVIEYLQQQNSTIKVIIFTVFDTDERIITAIKAGAKGYLLKGASRQEIFNAVRVVSQGGSLLQPAIASKVFQHISQEVAALSPREMEHSLELRRAYRPELRRPRNRQDSRPGGRPRKEAARAFPTCSQIVERSGNALPDPKGAPAQC